MPDSWSDPEPGSIADGTAELVEDQDTIESRNKAVASGQESALDNTEADEPGQFVEEA